VTYLRTASPLHAARAGIAAAWCAALIVAAVAVGQPFVLGTLALVVFAAAVCAGVGGRVARSLRISLPMALVIVAVNALVSRDGLTVLLRLGDAGPLGELDITLEAIAFGAYQALVLVVIVAVCALASAAIDPDELLRALRRRSFRSALTATIATRIVPLLALDARRIGEAQRCRPDAGRGRLAVMRAITANALDRSLDIAATLEVRGYGTARRPTRHRRPLSRHDLAFAASALAIVVLTFALRAPFQFYPSIEGSLDGTTLALAGALALAALAPFAQRRGTLR
jgi:energy-coupling factor transport system permease protein